MFGELEKICKTIGSTKAHINFLTQCLKGKLIPKGFISKSRINTLKSSQLESRFARISMTEQRRYLHGKLSVLENKEIEVTNRIHAELFKNQFGIEASSVQSIDANDILRMSRIGKIRLISRVFQHKLENSKNCRLVNLRMF